jgi:hypothetical protein
MIGEALYYDLGTLCTQAGYTVEAVRAAADVIRRARAGARVRVEPGAHCRGISN